MSDEIWRKKSVGALRALDPSVPNWGLIQEILLNVMGGWLALEPGQRAEQAGWAWDRLDQVLGSHPCPPAPGQFHAMGWDPREGRVLVRIPADRGAEGSVDMVRTILASGLLHPRHIPFFGLSEGAPDAMRQTWTFLFSEERAGQKVQVWSKDYGLPPDLDKLDDPKVKAWRKLWFDAGGTWYKSSVPALSGPVLYQLLRCQDVRPEHLLSRRDPLESKQGDAPWYGASNLPIQALRPRLDSLLQAASDNPPPQEGQVPAPPLHWTWSVPPLVEGDVMSGYHARLACSPQQDQEFPSWHVQWRAGLGWVAFETFGAGPIPLARVSRRLLDRLIIRT